MATLKPLQTKGFRANFLRTPNGIRTRAATLKGWMRSIPRCDNNTGQVANSLERISECEVLGVPRAFDELSIQVPCLLVESENTPAHGQYHHQINQRPEYAHF